MCKKTKMKMINGLMAGSLIIVMGSGILLKSFPEMWLGVIHGMSGMVLTVSIVTHCFQHKA